MLEPVEPAADLVEVWRKAVYAYGGMSIEGGEGEFFACQVLQAHMQSIWDKALDEAAEVALYAKKKRESYEGGVLDAYEAIRALKEQRNG